MSLFKDPFKKMFTSKIFAFNYEFSMYDLKMLVVIDMYTVYYSFHKYI